MDPSNGISNGYSDAKITTYNLSTTGIEEYLTDDKRSSYSYEYYNEDPGLKVIYNASYKSPNRNEEQASIGTSFWLSSRCTGAYWSNAAFRIRFMSDMGSFSYNSVYSSTSSTYSYCHGLRPVLQVAK